MRRCDDTYKIDPCRDPRWAECCVSSWILGGDWYRSHSRTIASRWWSALRIWIKDEPQANPTIYL